MFPALVNVECIGVHYATITVRAQSYWNHASYDWLVDREQTPASVFARIVATPRCLLRYLSAYGRWIIAYRCYIHLRKGSTTRQDEGVGSRECYALAMGVCSKHKASVPVATNSNANIKLLSFS